MSPKLFAAIATAITLMGAAYAVTAKIKYYGAVQYQAGRADCESAVMAQAKKAKDAVSAAQDATAQDAANVQTVYVDVVRTIAVTDAVSAAQTEALRVTIKDLKQRLDNEKPDTSICAAEPIPSSSVSIHDDIDKLLRSD